VTCLHNTTHINGQQSSLITYQIGPLDVEALCGERQGGYVDLFSLKT